MDCQASLSITNSQSLLKLMSIELVMPFSHLTLCRPLLLPPSILPSIRVFSKESLSYLDIVLPWEKGVGLWLVACCPWLGVRGYFPPGHSGEVNLLPNPKLIALLTAHQANKCKRRGVEARNTTSFWKPADWEDSRLMSQNNHLNWVWMSSSFTECGCGVVEQVK